MILELNNFKCQLVIYCTVDCTVGEQVYFKFGAQSWTQRSWGPVLKQWFCPLPSPQTSSWGRNLLKWLVIETLSWIPELKKSKCKCVSARELEHKWTVSRYPKLRSRLLWASKGSRTPEREHCPTKNHWDSLPPCLEIYDIGKLLN